METLPELGWTSAFRRRAKGAALLGAGALSAARRQLRRSDGAVETAGRIDFGQNDGGFTMMNQQKFMEKMVGIDRVSSS